MTKIVKAGPQAYIQAAYMLQAGGLVALPTETVYGLAALASNDKAVAQIYASKGRPAHNPLILHLLERAQAADYVHIPPLAKTLMQAFWPGPLTLVLPVLTTQKAALMTARAGSRLQTLALRQPKAPWREAFLKAGFKGPLVMPSANRSGHVSPTTARHVADDLGGQRSEQRGDQRGEQRRGQVDLIIDAGPCPGGIESTVLKIETDHAILLRPGAIPAEAFIPYISDLRPSSPKQNISAPGMLTSHYAPKAKIRLGARDKQPGEAYLGFGPHSVGADLNLSVSGELKEAAQNLYAYLRRLDSVAVIAVAPIPHTGVGEAINDRLQRAAAPK